LGGLSKPAFCAARLISCAIFDLLIFAIVADIIGVSLLPTKDIEYFLGVPHPFVPGHHRHHHALDGVPKVPLPTRI